MLRRLLLGRTFSCAQLAHVCPAVVLVHGVEKQPALPSIEVHFTVEQRRLDQFPVSEPVHIGVLGSDDVTLEQDRLACVGCEVPDRADDGQARLNWWSWV